jgi:protein-tyrosine phosphatase
MDYLWLPVLDAHPPTIAQIFTGIAWIEQHLQQGGTVYIHCAAGIGRSPMLLTCWYMYTRAMPWPHAWQGIKKRRPQVALTRRQMQRLEEFARLLRRRQ